MGKLNHRSTQLPKSIRTARRQVDTVLYLDVGRQDGISRCKDAADQDRNPGREAKQKYADQCNKPDGDQHGKKRQA